MHRRLFLVATATALAGCATSSDTTTTASRTGSPTPSPVNVDATDATADAPDVSLNIKYTARTRFRLPTDPPTLADDGQKWLLIGMVVTNAGADAVELDGSPFVVDDGESVYDYVVTRADWSLAGTTITPKESATGWVTFAVPESLATATLTVRENARRGYAVTFTPTSEQIDPPS